MTIDSYSIKISASRVAIDGKLELDEDVKIMIDGYIQDNHQSKQSKDD